MATTKKMRTSLAFGDGGRVEIHNVALGDVNDHCAGDIANLRAAIEGDGAVVISEFSLACDAPPSSTAGVNTTAIGQQPNKRRAHAQARQEVSTGG